MKNKSTTLGQWLTQKKQKAEQDARVLNELQPKQLPLAQRHREILFMISLALAIFLLFAFLTYAQDDPGWSYARSLSQVHNAEGWVGAWIADFGFYTLGYVAYLLPMLLLYFSIALLWFWDQFEASLRLIPHVVGLMLVMVSMTGLTSLYMDATHPLSQHLPAGAGGVLGASIIMVLIKAFKPLGSTLVLTTMAMTGLSLFFSITWIHFIDGLGMWVLRAIRRCHQGMGYLWGLCWSPPKTLATPLPKKPKKQDLIAREPPPKKPIPMPQHAHMPSLNLLSASTTDHQVGYTDSELTVISQEVETKLLDFGISAKVVSIYPGPVITRFELQLAAGTKASKITALSKDLARSLSVVSVRVVEVIAGKSVVGLELPNKDRELVRLKAVLSTEVYKNSFSPLTLVLGKDIAGHPVVADLAKMPHLLVAGTTGSGKSVGLNTMLLSLLYKSQPSALRLILIDPKMLELAVYDGIPHLLAPVVTDMKQAANALRWCVAEMERRYQLMAALGVRNLTGYNKKVKSAQAVGKPITDPLWQSADGAAAPTCEALPYIVVLIDEFADMMMVVGKKVEQLIARIAQKARAAGIHLILATQRPSVDVITGLIKANVPGRIAFQVSSRIDSRTILDQQGAEQLLGHGDMLYLPPGTSIPVRVHGAFVEDDEVHAVVKEIASMGATNYVAGLLDGQVESPDSGDLASALEDGEQDDLYGQAVDFVTQARRVSISSVQRRFKIGYNRAARIIEQMEASGVISSMNTNGVREVVAPAPRDRD